MKSKKTQSFKREILVCLIILSLLPMLISDTVLNQVVKTTIENNDRHKAQEQVTLINERFLAYMDEIDEVSANLAMDSTIYTGVDTNSKWKMNQVYVNLYEKSAGLREYADFYIYDVQGACRYATVSYAAETTMPVYWGILNDIRSSDDLVLRNVAKTGRDDGVLLQLGRGIVDESNSLCGYLVVNVSKTQFEEYFGKLLSQQYGVAIMDRFWEEIYSSEPANGENMIATLRERTLAGEHLSQDSDAMLISMEKLDEIDVYTVVGVNKVFQKDIETMMLIVMLIISGISLVLCFVIAESMSYDLSQPIRRLSNAMNKVKEGDLTIQAKTERNDELGQLTRDFNHMTRRLKQNMEMQLQQQEQINEANIAMMQAQLNPHFLYNTLDTMKWIAKANHIEELVTLSSGLAKILRMSISAERFVTLNEEIKMVESYVDIQKIRFKDKFFCDIEIPMELEERIVPKLILQPIVENAILHGLKECEEGSIFINIYEKDDVLLIEVSDDGIGIEEEVAKQINERSMEKRIGHIGLRNVDAILSLHYGAQYGVSAERIAEGGTKVTLRLPGKNNSDVKGIDC